MASLTQFLTHGEIGQVKLGLEQVSALVYLGDPPVFIGSPTIIGANVWKYGDLELEFHHHELTRLTVYVTDRTELPNEVGNSIGFPSRSWTEADFQNWCGANGIECDVIPGGFQTAAATATFENGMLTRLDARN